MKNCFNGFSQLIYEKNTLLMITQIIKEITQIFNRYGI